MPWPHHNSSNPHLPFEAFTPDSTDFYPLVIRSKRLLLGFIGLSVFVFIFSSVVLFISEQVQLPVMHACEALLLGIATGMGVVLFKQLSVNWMRAYFLLITCVVLYSLYQAVQLMNSIIFLAKEGLQMAKSVGRELAVEDMTTGVIVLICMCLIVAFHLVAFFFAYQAHTYLKAASLSDGSFRTKDALRQYPYDADMNDTTPAPQRFISEAIKHSESRMSETGSRVIQVIFDTFPPTQSEALQRNVTPPLLTAAGSVGSNKRREVVVPPLLPLMKREGTGLRVSIRDSIDSNVCSFISSNSISSTDCSRRPQLQRHQSRRGSKPRVPIPRIPVPRISGFLTDRSHHQLGESTDRRSRSKRKSMGTAKSMTTGKSMTTERRSRRSSRQEKLEIPDRRRRSSRGEIEDWQSYQSTDDRMNTRRRRRHSETSMQSPMAYSKKKTSRRSSGLSERREKDHRERGPNMRFTATTGHFQAPPSNCSPVYPSREEKKEEKEEKKEKEEKENLCELSLDELDIGIVSDESDGSKIRRSRTKRKNRLIALIGAASPHRGNSPSNFLSRPSPVRISSPLTFPFQEREERRTEKKSSSSSDENLVDLPVVCSPTNRIHL